MTTVDTTGDNADVVPAPSPSFITHLPHLSDLGRWFLYSDSHGFYSFSISLPPTSDRIVRIALGRKLPFFDLEKLLLNFSRDTEPEEHKKVEST